MTALRVLVESAAYSCPIGLPSQTQIITNSCASQQLPPQPLACAHHNGIARQNATFTPSVMLRPLSGAAVLMNEVCA